MAYEDRYRNFDDRRRLRPERYERNSSDYGPHESGYVRGYDDYRGGYGDQGADHQRDFGYSGGYGGGMGSSRYPRMGREDWSSDDLGYGDGLRRSGSDRSQARQRYDSEGYYPSDHPEYRGGYGRAEAGNGWRRDRGFMEKASDEVASWFGDREAERRRDLDQHRGKGPRGYKRTDARVLEDVNDRLSDDPAVDASDIDVQVADGEVTLSGEVSSRYGKRRAEDVAESVSGVHNVQNNIRVRRASPSDASSTTSFS